MGTATGVEKVPPVLWLIFLGHLVQAKLLTYIFERWAGISTFGTGLQAGAIIGLMVALTYGFITLGTTNIMTFQGMLVDAVISTIISGIAGGAIGWALGKWGEKRGT